MREQKYKTTTRNTQLKPQYLCKLPPVVFVRGARPRGVMPAPGFRKFESLGGTLKLLHIYSSKNDAMGDQIFDRKFALFCGCVAGWHLTMRPTSSAACFRQCVCSCRILQSWTSSSVSTRCSKRQCKNRLWSRRSEIFAASEHAAARVLQHICRTRGSACAENCHFTHYYHKSESAARASPASEQQPPPDKATLLRWYAEAGHNASEAARRNMPINGNFHTLAKRIRRAVNA